MVADGKTANVIKSTISGAFDVFLQDPNLAETFCQPSTFSFEDLPQEGKIVGLVPGDQYEQLGRLLGTACKLDFQSTLLARNGRADLNSSRLVLYFADECHKYIISGSATAGDPYFMNLSRSNNIVNICATPELRLVCRSDRPGGGQSLYFRFWRPVLAATDRS